LVNYGVPGEYPTEVINSSSDTAEWVVLSLLIDDKDSTNKGRTALLNSNIKQAGVSRVDNSGENAVGWVTVVNLDNTYKTNGPYYSAC